MNPSELFLEYKNLVFSIAYNMLGTVADAEDMVQETYLKWMSADIDSISYPKAYLVKMVTNLSINHMNSARKQREDYFGFWLPEPLVDEKVTDSFKSIDLYHSLSIGMMVLLERLTAVERAVFLLKEVFVYDYAEIAEITEKSEENCRQVFKRAKDHLGNREKRFTVDLQAHENILNQFTAACMKGDMAGLIDLLKEDIVLVADGGGKSFSANGKKFVAAVKPIAGKDDVAKFVLGIMAKVLEFVPDFSFKIKLINGLPSIATYSGATPISVICLEVAGRQISNLYVHANPDKMKQI